MDAEVMRAGWRVLAMTTTSPPRLLVSCLALAGVLLGGGGDARAAESGDTARWLARLNEHLARHSRVQGCTFPATTERELSPLRRAERGAAPLSPMERRFLTPSAEAGGRFETYRALRDQGFVRDNAGDTPPTFSLTLKGWKSFPVGPRDATCIEWSARDRATAIVAMSARAGMRQLVYRAIPEFPDWLPAHERAQYAQRLETAELPESAWGHIKYGYSRWFGELAARDPARVRSRFPSDAVAIALAQEVLSPERSTGPCVPVGAGDLRPHDAQRESASEPALYFAASIHSRHLRLLRALASAGYVWELELPAPIAMRNGTARYGFQLLPPYMALLGDSVRMTCIRYGTAVAREVVRAPDGRPGSLAQFVVWYTIEDHAPWLALPGVRENLPDNARLCLEHGSLLWVDMSGTGGSMDGCSLPWGDL